MSNYIDRGKLLKHIDKVIQHGAKDENGNHLISLEIVRDYVADMPTEWISIKDRLPDEIGKVLVIDNGKIDINSWAGKYEGWYYANKNITHWMPLPELPKESDAE